MIRERLAQKIRLLAADEMEKWATTRKDGPLFEVATHLTH